MYIIMYILGVALLASKRFVCESLGWHPLRRNEIFVVTVTRGHTQCIIMYLYSASDLYSGTRVEDKSFRLYGSGGQSQYLLVN